MKASSNLLSVLQRTWKRTALLSLALTLPPAYGLAGDHGKHNKNGQGGSVQNARMNGNSKSFDANSAKHVNSSRSPLTLDKKPDQGLKLNSNLQTSQGLPKNLGSSFGSFPADRFVSDKKQGDHKSKDKVDSGKLKDALPKPNGSNGLGNSLPKDLKNQFDLGNVKQKDNSPGKPDLKGKISDDFKNRKPQLDLGRKKLDLDGKKLDLDGKKLDLGGKKLDLGGKKPDLGGKNFKPGDIKTVKDDGKKNFMDLHKAGKFDGVVKGAVAKKIDLGKQLDLKHKGDLALKLNLAQKVKLNGGWKSWHWAGLVAPGFGVGCSPIAYCGPWYYPSHCLMPSWCDWVSFCWSYHCDPIWDPRPWFCRPIVYQPCWSWVWWDYPVWVELPVAVCGTWVDVQPVVIDSGLDLQLLAVRFVDPGHPELGEGPRYRVWIRNNSTRTIVEDFNVLLMAANTREAAADLPQAGLRVTAIEPGQIQALDIRLPVAASAMGRDEAGNPTPFSQLHVLVDSHREVPEVFEENNGAVIARGDILPVDPVIMGIDATAPLAGSELSIAGEGFGPEPGQVLMNVGGVELQAEILGWYDLGVRVRLPALALASSTEAQLIVVRGDTAASNPQVIQLGLPVASR